MKTYRRRPPEIKAVQFLGEITEEISQFVGNRISPDNSHWSSTGYFLRERVNSKVRLQWGDWIVQGEYDDFVVLTEDEFNKYYEPIK